MLLDGAALFSKGRAAQDLPGGRRLMAISDQTTIKVALIEGVKRHQVMFGVMVAYWGLCFSLGVFYDRQINPLLYAPVFALMFVLIGFFHGAKSSMTLVRQPGVSFDGKALYTDLRARFRLSGSVEGLLVMTGFCITISLFQSVKAVIPVIKPFAYDARFAEMDRVIHGGFYPHELLQPLMGYPLVTFAVLILYNLWLPLVFVVFISQVLDRSDPVLRQRYLLSFALGWILIGTIGAVALSSAGPAYYARVLDLAPGTGPYAGLVAYYGAAANVVPLFLTDMHEMLWGIFESGVLQPGAGISAMPSVHVALATHMFLVARHKGRKRAWVFGIYACVILVGSVHLGWHYAVDGYLGGALMALIWWLSGLVSRPFDHDQGALG